MNNLIYIVIGLVIVLILAFVLLRSKKSAPPPRQPATVAPPRPTHDRASQAVPAAAPNYQDRLNTAQRFIDQQRYDDAISELKQGLVSHPHNKDITLKLLNIYALTNRNGPFSDLYQSIQMQGDAATLTAANNIKSLLDEEQASSRPAAPAAAAVVAAEPERPIETFDTNSNNEDLSLDFDYSADVATDAPQAEEDHMSFDDLESQLLADTSPAVEADQSRTESVDADEGFEFTVEDSDNTGLSLETSTEAQPVAEDNTFSLALDEPQAEAHQPTTTTEDNLFSLEDDFGLTNDTTESVSSATSNEATEEPADFLELEDLIGDESSDALNTELADAAAATQTVELDASDLEFNELSFADIENNELGSDDEFSFDVTETEDAPTETTAPVTVDATSASDLNDEGFATESADTESLDTDSFALEESVPTETLATVTDAEPTVLETTETSPSVDMPASATDDSQFAADFDYVNELDSVQVTIDLAAQYLELGEYESAKRLLKEVANQGTTEQQSQIESLLAKAA
jgi:pilus assembly protein FimV